MSQPSELVTLEAAGVVSISLDYTLSPKRDRFGNLFRYRGTAEIRKRNGEDTRTITIYDVYLHQKD